MICEWISEAVAVLLGRGDRPPVRFTSGVADRPQEYEPESDLETGWFGGLSAGDPAEHHSGREEYLGW